VVVAGKLDESRVREPCRHIPTVLDRHGAVAAPVQHERRTRDLRDRVVHVRHHRLPVVVAPRTSADGVPLELQQPLVERFVAHAARREPLEAAVIPRVHDHVHDIVDRLDRRSSLELVLRRRGEEDEGLASFRMRRSEEHRDEGAVVGADDRRALRAHRVEDCDHVYDLRIEVRERVERDGVGEACPSTIEVDQAAERREPAEEAGELGEVPDRLDMVHPRVDEQDVDRAVSHDLIRDVHVADLGEPGLLRVGHGREGNAAVRGSGALALSRCSEPTVKFRGARCR
jgi:hypothetical protein